MVEILNFQGTNPIFGMGSLSKILFFFRKQVSHPMHTTYSTLNLSYRIQKSKMFLITHFISVPYAILLLILSLLNYVFYANLIETESVFIAEFVFASLFCFSFCIILSHIEHTVPVLYYQTFLLWQKNRIKNFFSLNCIITHDFCLRNEYL